MGKFFDNLIEILRLIMDQSILAYRAIKAAITKSNCHWFTSQVIFDGHNSCEMRDAFEKEYNEIVDKYKKLAK